MDELTERLAAKLRADRVGLPHEATELLAAVLGRDLGDGEPATFFVVGRRVVLDALPACDTDTLRMMLSGVAERAGLAGPERDHLFALVERKTHRRGVPAPAVEPEEAR